jgi:transposase
MDEVAQADFRTDAEREGCQACRPAIDRAQGARIWMASEATDMRCGFDRLAERVKTVIGENPQSGHLFVFRSRRGDRLKILLWDRDGFVLWYNQQSSHYTSFD